MLIKDCLASCLQNNFKHTSNLHKYHDGPLIVNNKNIWKGEINRLKLYELCKRLNDQKEGTLSTVKTCIIY